MAKALQIGNRLNLTAYPRCKDCGVDLHEDRRGVSASCLVAPFCLSLGVQSASSHLIVGALKVPLLSTRIRSVFITTSMRSYVEGGGGGGGAHSAFSSPLKKWNRHKFPRWIPPASATRPVPPRAVFQRMFVPVDLSTCWKGRLSEKSCASRNKRSCGAPLRTSRAHLETH